MLNLPKKTLILLILALILLSAGGYFAYSKYQTLKDPVKAAKEEVRDVVNKVGKLMELPKDEEPTVATVSDVNKLKDQAFFKLAKNGDKVLIYTKTKKAILYRPSTNKIIDVAPVNIGEAAETKPHVLKVALYNGTTRTGLTKLAEEDLKDLKNIEVISKENAEKQDYSKSIVVDFTGKNKTVADSIAKIVGGEVGSLPSGETKPQGADILVILGSTYVK